MYNIIPLILILVSLAIILVIVLRKFPALASLDVDNIPAEKEAKFKEQIISNRMKRSLIKWTSWFFKYSRLLSEQIQKGAKWIYAKLHSLREGYLRDDKAPVNEDEKDNKIKALFAEIEECYKKEENSEVEKRLIEIIGLDSKNTEAFEALGNLYYEMKNYEESKQTFKHALKLFEDDDNISEKAEIYNSLHWVEKDTDNYDEASRQLKEALKIESNNPRYLDAMLDLSIIRKDKVDAMDAFDKLAKVNPENKKLEEYQKQIKEL